MVSAEAVSISGSHLLVQEDWRLVYVDVVQVAVAPLDSDGSRQGPVGEQERELKGTGLGVRRQTETRVPS